MPHMCCIAFPSLICVFFRGTGLFLSPLQMHDLAIFIHVFKKLYSCTLIIFLIISNIAYCCVVAKCSE